jgi:O-antigen/teichoic acid export membrane protein
MSDNLRDKTVSGVVWSGMERFSVQGIQFLIQIVIARILSPSDFGLIGMLAIFLAISQTFIDSGFSNALIRKQNRSDIDFSTVFYFNVIVGIIAYFLLFFASPLIADFYDSPKLEPLTKFVALNLVINSFMVIPRTIFTVRVDFKTQAKASIVAAIVSGTAGIWMAYSGYGVWSLVVQSLINGTVGTVLLWIYSRWIPRRFFSMNSFREMFSFGSRLLISELINTTYINMYSIIIGKKFTAGDLGYYAKAGSFVQYPSSNLTSILGRVTFPILSGLQDDDERLKTVYRKYLRLSAFVIFPLMTGLAAIARPLIITLLTPKWEGAVLLMQIMCFSAMLYPIHSINLNLLQVKGRSDLFLRLELIKKSIGVLMLCVTIPMGIPAMCAGGIVISYIALIINTHYTGKLIQIGFLKQMRDLAPVFFASFSMCFVVWLVTRLFASDILKLAAGTIVGAVYYFLVSKIGKSEELRELIATLKELKNKYV